MKCVLILIERFMERFPEAVDMFCRNHVRMEIRAGISGLSEQDREELLPVVDALIPGPGIYNQDFLSRLKNLKILCRIGSGMDTIDVKWLEEHHVKVTNTKGMNANAVAEHTLALILAKLRDIPKLTDDLRAGRWIRSIPGRELGGKTIGLIGFGIIGKRLLELLQPFHVRIMAYDPFVPPEAIEKAGAISCSLDDLLSCSDIVSLHIPATPENIHFMDAEKISRMKKEAILINCARGALVDYDALKYALQKGIISGAAIDTFEHEPVRDTDHELLNLDQLIMTPHLAGTTVESLIADGRCAAKKIITYLNGDVET